MTETDIRPLGRASRGVTGIRLTGGDELAGALRTRSDAKMLIMTDCGYGKRVDFDEFTPHGRATGGQKIYTISEKTGEIVGLITVLDSDEVVCITSQGKTIRVKANTINTMGRAAQGVRILNIERPDILIGIDTVANEEEQLLEREKENFVSLAPELDLDGSDEVIDTGLVEDNDEDTGDALAEEESGDSDE
jgi:DNA gyrase subunit A